MAKLMTMHSSRQQPIITVAPSDSFVTSSHKSRQGLNDEVKELLWEEMLEGGWVKDDRIFKRLLDMNSAPYKPPPNFDAPLRPFQLERDLYPELMDLLKDITRHLDTQRFFLPTAFNPPQHTFASKSNLCPSIIMVPWKVGMEAATSMDKQKVVLWLQVQLFIEIKRSFTTRILQEAREQATTYARQVDHPCI